MTGQRILLVLVALAALALVFLLPRSFEENDDAGVPPIQLLDRVDDEAEERARERRQRAAYDRAAADLSGRFNENFAKFDSVDREVMAAAPGR